MSEDLNQKGFNDLVGHYDKQLVEILKVCCKAPDPLDHVAALMMAELTQAVVLARTIDFSPVEFLIAVGKAMNIGTQEFNVIISEAEAAKALAKMREGADETP